jgi:hypothetical protein
MQRRGSQDALDLFRGGSGQQPGAGSSAGSRGGITLPQGPLVRDRTPSTRSQPRYDYREAPSGGGWQPPAYAQGAGRFGSWDGLLLWFLLDTLNRPGHARAFHDNRSDPGVQAWRQDADRRAADDPALKSKLDELDRQTAALAGEPPQPGRLPPDVAGTQGSSGGGGFGFLLTVALVAGFAFITWRFFRRRRAAGAASAAAKGAEMGPIDTARGILRRKLDRRLQALVLPAWHLPVRPGAVPDGDRRLESRPRRAGQQPVLWPPSATSTPARSRCTGSISPAATAGSSCGSTPTAGRRSAAGSSPSTRSTRPTPRSGASGWTSARAWSAGPNSRPRTAPSTAGTGCRATAASPLGSGPRRWRTAAAKPSAGSTPCSIRARPGRPHRDRRPNTSCCR